VVIDRGNELLPSRKIFFARVPPGKGYAGEGSHPTQRKRVGWGCGEERRTMFGYGVGVGVGVGVGGGVELGRRVGWSKNWMESKMENNLEMGGAR
jgi:hypothetical protein